MEKLVSIFKKIAKLVTIILLLVLSVLQFIDFVSAFGSGEPFMSVIAMITQSLLLALLFGAPAILLLVKKEKEAKITLSFLLGYLFLQTVLSLIGHGGLIADGVPALTIIYAIVAFTLGLGYAFVLICFLLEKVFGIKLMKLGFLVLVVGLALVFILLVLQVIMAIKDDWGFGGFLNQFMAAIITPLLMVFGLMLLEGNE